MPVGEYMERTTHRQHLGWLAHLAEEMDRPSRSDWYAMQVAQRIDGAMGGKAGALDAYKLPFGEKKGLTASAVAASKEAAMRRTGRKPNK